MRINISVPIKKLKIIDRAAKKFYDGVRSRFLVDAGVKYAKELEDKEDKKN